MSEVDFIPQLTLANDALSQLQSEGTGLMMMPPSTMDESLGQIVLLVTCPLCRLTMIDPAATICGHVFCFPCLARALNNRPNPRLAAVAYLQTAAGAQIPQAYRRFVFGTRPGVELAPRRRQRQLQEQNDEDDDDDDDDDKTSMLLLLQTPEFRRWLKSKEVKEFMVDGLSLDELAGDALAKIKRRSHFTDVLPRQFQSLLQLPQQSNNNNSVNNDATNGQQNSASSLPDEALALSGVSSSTALSRSMSSMAATSGDALGSSGAVSLLANVSHNNNNDGDECGGDGSASHLAHQQNIKRRRVTKEDVCPACQRSTHVDSVVKLIPLKKFIEDWKQKSDELFTHHNIDVTEFGSDIDDDDDDQDQQDHDGNAIVASASSCLSASSSPNARRDHQEHPKPADGDGDDGVSLHHTTAVTPQLSPAKKKKKDLRSMLVGGGDVVTVATAVDDGLLMQTQPLTWGQHQHEHQQQQHVMLMARGGSGKTASSLPATSSSSSSSSAVARKSTSDSSGSTALLVAPSVSSSSSATSHHQQQQQHHASPFAVPNEPMMARTTGNSNQVGGSIMTENTSILSTEMQGTITSFDASSVITDSPVPPALAVAATAELANQDTLIVEGEDENDDDDQIDVTQSVRSSASEGEENKE